MGVGQSEWEWIKSVGTHKLRLMVGEVGSEACQKDPAGQYREVNFRHRIVSAETARPCRQLGRVPFGVKNTTLEGAPSLSRSVRQGGVFDFR